MSLKPEVHRLRWQRAGVGVLALAAIVSLAQSLKNAYERSQDFQWSGAHMLLAHIDPWAEYLRGDPHHLIHLSQIPNYLPVLYVAIAPLGLLPVMPAQLCWALLNVTFAVASAVLAARFFGLSRLATVAVVLLVLAATPTRMTIGNGQQSLFVLLLWCVSLLSARLTVGRSMLAGVSYCKFNFAPPVLLYLWLRGGLRAVLASAVPSVAATLLLWGWLGGGVHELRSLIMGPLTVSETGYFPSGGAPNLMDVLQAALFPHFAPGTFYSNLIVPHWVQLTTLAAALTACTVLLFVAVRRHAESSVQWQTALLATASFGLFKHHWYDGVVLLLPLCHALRLWRHLEGKIAIAAVFYMWYLERLLDEVHFLWRYLFFFEFAVLMVLLAMTYRLRRYEGELEPRWEPVQVHGERTVDGRSTS